MKFIACVFLGCVAAAQLASAATTRNFIPDGSKIFDQQREELKSLGCKPVPVKVTVMDELASHEEVRDHRFFPLVVVANRCVSECGFCGSIYSGKENGRCVVDPAGVRQKQVVVAFYDEETNAKKYQKVEVKEHTSCLCE